MTPLMGLAEVRALLGVSRQRADQIIRKPDFPPPLAELKTGKIWDASHVQRWASATGRVPLATQVEVLHTASTYIQWKGTGSVCMDFYCTCGAMPHVHGDFAYAVRCAECGTVWMMPDTFHLEKADPSYDGAMIQAEEEWDTETDGFVFDTTCDNDGTEAAPKEA